MSKYTTEVRYICEKATGYNESKGYSDIDKIISDSIDNIFSFNFPIFDESYRNVICSKILKHYYTREIGFETVGLWKLKLDTKLNEIMPFYNQLYNSELIKFNPLYDVDLQTTHVGDKNSESSKEENKSGFSVLNNEKSESGNSDRFGNIIEGENKSGNNNVDSTNVDGENKKGTASASEVSNNVQNSKENKNGSNSETGNDNKTKVNANNYTDSESGTNYDLYSDTPQGALNGVEEENYLTNARKITDSKTKSGKKDDSEIDNVEYSKRGSVNESNNIENNSVGNSNGNSEFEENSERTNVKNENSNYNEKNDRTSINSESIENNKNSTDKSDRSDIENMTGKDKYNSTESYVLHVVGKQAGVSYSKLLKEFRDTFLNIDMEVINSLSDLFMNLW